jgi:hypothetical protein
VRTYLGEEKDDDEAVVRYESLVDECTDPSLDTEKVEVLAVTLSWG